MGTGYTLCGALTFGQLFLCHSELCNNAIDNGIITKKSNTLIVFEKKRDSNYENAENWAIAEGFIFNFFQ